MHVYKVALLFREKFIARKYNVTRVGVSMSDIVECT